jgi:hypothetical protein
MERRLDIRAEEMMEESFQIPLWATLVFVVTMLAIFFMGRNVASYYAPIMSGQVVETVESV